MNLLYLIITAVAIGIDQLTKYLLYGQSFAVIGDFLWVESSFNTGAAFSIMSGAKWFFIVVSSLASVMMIYFILTKHFKMTKFTKICLAMIAGGALGNLIDRIWLGGVRDFIYFKSLNFAIFNIADSFVTIGCIMLIVAFIVSFFKTYKKGDNNGTQD